MADEEEQEGQVVEFPSEEDRLPPPRLPSPVGHIGSGHPLRRPLVIALIILGLILAVHFLVTIVQGGCSAPNNSEPTTFMEMHREPGAIAYEGKRLQGWFLDVERQHFLAEDGRRFTYVDSHEREGYPVCGHWRLME